MEVIMQTDARSRETRNLIASDRVEGTLVRSTNGSTIGTIERVMIDKITGKVAHAVLRSTGVGMAKRHLPIRWSRLTYDRTLAAYHVDLTERELSALSYESDIDWGDRGREIERCDDDRVKVYWGIAETW
jgi:sporulation protein YlmC with PRC-barrel domain